MTAIPTQAAVTRAVKAAIKGAHEMGYRVSAYEVTFNQGVPTVKVTTGPESPLPAPVQTGGKDAIEALRQRQKGCHARRS